MLIPPLKANLKQDERVRTEKREVVNTPYFFNLHKNVTLIDLFVSNTFKNYNLLAKIWFYTSRKNVLISFLEKK